MSTNELYLEPMTAGMILDRTFRLYVQNFSLMIGVTAMFRYPSLRLRWARLWFDSSIPSWG